MKKENKEQKPVADFRDEYPKFTKEMKHTHKILVPDMLPVHFGIIVMMNLAVGSLTPPVGTTLFAGCAVGHMSIEKVSKALIPFYICMVIVLLMVTYIPAVSMFLPNLLMGAAV